MKRHSVEVRCPDCGSLEKFSVVGVDRTYQCSGCGHTGRFTVDEDIYDRYTMANIVAANKVAGFFFFSPGAMDCFDSRIESETYSGPGGVYFVTSEQFHGSDGSSLPRKYNVRKFDKMSSRIHTIEPHNQMEDRDEAVRLAIKCSGASSNESSE